MSNHYISYTGHVCTSLAAMQRKYIDDRFMEGVNDCEVTEGVLMKAPVTLEEELEWYDKLSSQKGNVIFAVLAKTGCPDDPYMVLGHTGIHKIVYPDAHGSSGTLLWRKELFQKGHGTEAKLLLLHHAFNVLGLRKVTSEVKAFNARSLGHLIKCGYEIVGRRREHHLHNRKLVDEIQLEVFYEDFEPIWEKYNETKSLPTLTKVQRKLVTRETKTE
jgi:RimJ/RimL family protein N-acetyltransferase